jgi:hypothetical protein
MARTFDGRDVWCATADVAPADEDDPEWRGAAGGFINVAARAEDESSFSATAWQALDALGMRLIDLEDVRRADDLDKDAHGFRALARRAVHTGVVAFGVLHRYPFE